MISGNDIDLLAALKTGSKIAFERLYKESLQLLWGEAYRILGNKESADDVVQELFIEVWEKKLFDKVENNIRSYLFTCIRRKCYKIVGNKNTLREISTSIEDSITFYPDEYAVKELNNEINAAMKAMPPQSSKAFELYILEGKKRKEVASEMGISDNTAKSYLATALKIARAKLLNFKKNTPI